MTSQMKPRGIRNNNPLNIRRSRSKWKGLCEHQTDKHFCQFTEMKYGWRAAFYLLCSTYYRTWGCNTIRTIISRWAPDNENNTEAYIKQVCDLTGMKHMEPIGHPEKYADSWLKLGWAMAIVENGKTAMQDMDGLDEYEGFKLAMATCYPEGR